MVFAWSSSALHLITVNTMHSAAYQFGREIEPSFESAISGQSGPIARSDHPVTNALSPYAYTGVAPAQV